MSNLSIKDIVTVTSDSEFNGINIAVKPYGGNTDE